MPKIQVLESSEGYWIGNNILMALMLMLMLILMLMLVSRLMLMLRVCFAGNSCDRASSGPALLLLLSLVLIHYCSAEVFQYCSIALLTGTVLLQYCSAEIFQYLLTSIVFLQYCCNKIISQPLLVC